MRVGNSAKCFRGRHAVGDGIGRPCSPVAAGAVRAARCGSMGAAVLLTRLPCLPCTVSLQSFSNKCQERLCKGKWNTAGNGNIAGTPEKWQASLRSSRATGCPLRTTQHLI